MSSFHIFIKFNNFSTVTINNLRPTTTVAELKQKVKDQEGSSNVDGIRLIYGGRQLSKDNLTLSDYKIQSHATLFAVLRLYSGGGKSQNCGPDVEREHKGKPGKNGYLHYMADNGLSFGGRCGNKQCKAYKQPTLLTEMSQNELISWIQSLPEDPSFSATVKQEIIKGIEQYVINEGSAVTGEDFYEAEDAGDIMELTGVKKKSARAMFRKTAVKKQEEFDKKTPNKASNKKCQSEVFTLYIQAMRGRMYKIKNVTKATYVREVKERFLLEAARWNKDAARWYEEAQLNKDDAMRRFGLRKTGKYMMDNKTLEDYGITNALMAAMPLVVSFKVFG